MAVSGIPEEIGRHGDMLLRPPTEVQTLAPPQLFDADPRPLSSGLVSPHNNGARAAHDFAIALEDGITAAGKGLIEIELHLAEFDRQGADAIARLFPTPAPGNGGGR